MTVIKRLDQIDNPDGNIQRFLTVSGFGWNDIAFTQAPFRSDFIKSLAQLYRVAIIPKNPTEAGHLIFFHVPDTVDTASMPRTIGGVTYYDATANLAAWIESGDPKSESLLNAVIKAGFCDTADGSGAGARAMPVSNRFGCVSDAAKAHDIACNAHFFLMDTFDALSPYDLFGTPYGMTVQKGTMILPPLHHRPALVVDTDGKTRIAHPELTEVSVTIDGKTYVHGKNCLFFERPDTEMTPPCSGSALLVADGRVIASKKGGAVRVPMGGFAIQTEKPVAVSDPHCSFQSDTPYAFALQVGPAMTENGKPAVDFSGCPFCEFGKMTAFPPTVYPLSWDGGRAGRIVLGADKDDLPVLIWAEAASIHGHVKGKESPGCSLKEMAAYCARIGLQNSVNLDGGGSSQLLVNGERFLHLKDRTADNREAERPVPGIIVIS